MDEGHLGLPPRPSFLLCVPYPFPRILQAPLPGFVSVSKLNMQTQVTLTKYVDTTCRHKFNSHFIM